MNVLISLSLAIAPAVILVVYYYKKDKLKPEPKGLVLKIFFLGILSIIPAIILELIVSRIQPLFKPAPLLFYAFEAFLVASLCEEFIKLVIVRFFAFNNKAFDEVMDGIVYTVVASLGFACFENVMYVLDGGIYVALLRAFTAVPMHALASGIMGYYIGKAKFAEGGERRAFFLKGFFFAFMIHGVYDFLLMGTPVFGTLPALLIFPLLIIVFFWLGSLIKKALKEDLKEGRVEDKR